jgi:hypothetical protein
MPNMSNMSNVKVQMPNMSTNFKVDINTNVKWKTMNNT